MLDLFSKKIILVFGLVFIASFSQAQQVGSNLPNYDKQWIHFGITMGGNVNSYKIYRDISLNSDDSIMAVNSGRMGGFNLGIISNISFLDHFDFRVIPTLSFAERRIKYLMVNHEYVHKDVESIYLDIPFHFKIKSVRMDNFRFYVLGGGKYAMDMISSANAKNRQAKSLVLTKFSNWSREYGVGTDFYFEMFKFSIEVKVSEGLNNVMVEKPDFRYTTVIDKLLPKTFLVSLHFE